MQNMKLCIFYFVTIFSYSLGMSEELTTLFGKIHEKCKVETGVTEESIQSSKNGGTFAEDKEFKCYLKCTMKELKVMNDGGEIDVDDAIANLPKEMVEMGADSMIKTCGIKKGADDCETAWLTVKCYQETDPANFMTI